MNPEYCAEGNDAFQPGIDVTKSAAGDAIALPTKLTKKSAESLIANALLVRCVQH
jgi:hypothetical protein